MEMGQDRSWQEELWDTGRAESQLGNRGEIIFTLNDM